MPPLVSFAMRAATQARAAEQLAALPDEAKLALASGRVTAVPRTGSMFTATAADEALTREVVMGALAWARANFVGGVRVVG